MKKLFIIASLCLVLGAVFMPAQRVLAEEATEEPVVKTGHITDPEFRGIAWQMMGSILDSRMELYSTSYDVDWTVYARKMYGTSYFKKTKGSTVSIDITTSANAKGGIIDDDGKMTYVEGKKLKYVFSISKDDYYSVFVQNNNWYAITAKGEYAK